MDLFLRTCNTERMNVERLVARVFVIVGGIVWALMLFASSTTQRYSDLTYTFNEIVDAGLSAAIPLVITVGVFTIALFYERLAAAVLAIGAAAVLVWGLSAGWEGIVWGYVAFVVVAPMIVAAVLFLLAARTQHVCELEGVTARG